MSGANADAWTSESTSFRRPQRKQCAMRSGRTARRNGRGRAARVSARHSSCFGDGSVNWRVDLQTPVAVHPNGSNHMKKVLRITGARIAQLGEPPAILDNTDIWIADGRILALLPIRAPAPVEGQVETLSFQNALVIPGM